MKYYIHACLFVLFASKSVFGETAPDHMRLFLLIGQSNMAGRGKMEPQDEVTNPRIYMLTKDGKWVLAKDPVHFDKPVAGVGSLFGVRTPDYCNRFQHRGGLDSLRYGWKQSG